MPAIYRLRTLGGLTLESGGSPHAGPATQRRRLALLALLAGSDAGVSRERIASLLWPDADSARSRHSVDDALSALRRALGDDDLFLGVGTLRLNPAVLASDVMDHAAALASGNFERAVELYTGPFLDGFSLPGADEFQRWTDTERRRHADSHARALEALATMAEQRGEDAEAVRRWKARVAADPLDTSATLRLMNTLSRVGSVTEALRVARVHETLVREELDCEPGPQWADAVSGLRRDIGRAPDVATLNGVALADATGGASARHDSPALTRDHPSDVAVAPAADETTSPLAQSSRGNEPVGRAHRGSRIRRAAVALTAVAACAAVGGALWLRHPGASERPADPAVSRVLVLPFENSTGDSTLAPLGRMAADWVAQGLAQINGLAVISSLANLEPGSASIRSAASENGANTVVSGAYYVDGDSIRLQVQLTEVDGWKLMEGISPVSAPRSVPTALLEPLRQRAMAALAVAHDPRYAVYASGTKPPTYEAYEQYLAGAAVFEKGDMLGAIPYWTRAAALDTTYVQPLISIADGYTGQGQMAPADSLVRLMERRHLMLSPADQGQLQRLRGNIDGDLLAALEGARMTTGAAPGAQLPRMLHASSALRAGFPNEAIAVAAPIARSFGRNRPSLPSLVYWERVTSAHHMLGDYEGELAAARLARAYHPTIPDIAAFELRALAALGRVDSLDERLSRLVAMPAPWVGWSSSGLLLNIAQELRAHGHEAAAISTLRLVLAEGGSPTDVARRSASIRFDLARASYLLGDYPTAARLCAGLAGEQPDDFRYVACAGLVAAHRGQRGNALRAAARLGTLRRPYDRGQTTYARAQLAAALGDTTEALSLLRQSLREGAFYDTALHSDPELASLRGDPAFRALLAPRG